MGGGGKYGGGGGGKGGKGGGGKGGKGGGKPAASCVPGIPWDGPLPPFPKNKPLHLHPADADAGFGFIGDSLLRARRMESEKPWIGMRANCGVSKGKVAFAFLNETGGNVRLGWSTIDATLELGMDTKSYGFGGTGTASHAGKYSKYGTTYGKYDVVTALLDLERNAVRFMVNEHEVPIDAFSIERENRGKAFFPHVLLKEAQVEVYFGPNPTNPPININPPDLPAGFKWLSEVVEVYNPRTSQAVPMIVDAEAAAEETKKALAKMMTSMAKNQACHREQFEEWKENVRNFVNYFQRPLKLEMEEEVAVAKRRLAKPLVWQVKNGYGAMSMRVELRQQQKLRGQDVQMLKITSRRNRMPNMSELGYGRTLMITPEHLQPSFHDTAVTITCEIEEMEPAYITASTTYDKLPYSKDYTYRIDLGPNLVTFQRMSMILDRLQRQEPSHVLGPGQVGMGILNPGTDIANAFFEAVQKSSADARISDPSVLPQPNPDAAISKAARAPAAHAPDRRPARKPPAEILELSPTQRVAWGHVINEKRKLTFIQGPPGTGKTMTAVEIVIGWLQKNKGPILVTAFSNQGTDNLCAGLWKRGVEVARVGACPHNEPWSMSSRMKNTGASSESQVIQNADVVAATCIGAGMPMLRQHSFPYVVVDEAAQIMEPACMVPITKGCVQLVMVGDQCQLPATVISKTAEQQGLAVSLFERMISKGMEFTTLDIQYRMHALLAHFASYFFYQRKLRTGVAISARTHDYLAGMKPLGFTNVTGQESHMGTSTYNTHEAEAVAAFVTRLAFGQKVRPDQVGIITPYAAQVREIKRQLRLYAPDDFCNVQVSSVDSFQGQENEVIILSTVRCNEGGDLGFVSDWRRLNVSLTRAKKMCMVFGNLRTLVKTPLFRDWIGFHATLPSDTVSWYDWKGDLEPLANDVEGMGMVLFANREFRKALAQGAKGRIKLSKHSDYPGMIVEDALLKTEIGKEIDKRRTTKAKAVIGETGMSADAQMDSLLLKYLQHAADEGSVVSSIVMNDVNEGHEQRVTNRQAQELRIDPEDGEAYTKEEFLDCYGGEDEWNAAKPLPRQHQAAAPLATPPPAKPAAAAKPTAPTPAPAPAAPAPAARAAPAATAPAAPEKPKEPKKPKVTADEVKLLQALLKAMSLKEVEDIENQLMREKKRHRHAIAAQRQKEAEEAEAADEEEELRVDLSDGHLYTKADFMAQYGGLKEWDAAPHSIERRIDPADGLAYTKEDFMAQYGGTKEWDAAGAKKIEQLEEKRIDPSDGMAYTKAEFTACYGGTAEWDGAAAHEILQKRQRTRRNR